MFLLRPNQWLLAVVAVAFLSALAFSAEQAPASPEPTDAKGPATATPATPLPEGHPPIDAAPDSTLPEGHPPIDAAPDSTLPEGHPPVGGAPAAAGSGSSMETPASAPAPATPAGSGSAMEAPKAKPVELSKDGLLELDEIKLKPPKGWTMEQPASEMRKAQFAIPKASGDPEDGQAAIFYFGPAAGSVEANVKRWCEQFEQLDGKSSEEVAKREQVKAGKIDVTLIDLSGHMKSPMAPITPGPTKDNYRLLAAIIEAPSGPWFVKATGPAKTMEASAKEFREFVLSVQAK